MCDWQCVICDSNKEVERDGCFMKKLLAGLPFKENNLWFVKWRYDNGDEVLSPMGWRTHKQAKNYIAQMMAANGSSKMSAYNLSICRG